MGSADFLDGICYNAENVAMQSACIMLMDIYGKLKLHPNSPFRSFQTAFLATSICVIGIHLDIFI